MFAFGSLIGPSVVVPFLSEFKTIDDEYQLISENPLFPWSYWAICLLVVPVLCWMLFNIFYFKKIDVEEYESTSRLLVNFISHSLFYFCLFIILLFFKLQKI